MDGLMDCRARQGEEGWRTKSGNVERGTGHLGLSGTNHSLPLQVDSTKRHIITSIKSSDLGEWCQQLLYHARRIRIWHVT